MQINRRVADTRFTRFKEKHHFGISVAALGGLCVLMILLAVII
jgi:hypothetical protein